jgi:hypothetical protein
MKAAICLVISVIILLLTIPCKSQDTFTEGYKTAKWGMSKEQVKSEFKDMPIKDDGSNFNFPTTIANEDVTVMFFFIHDMLYEVVLGFEINTSNKNKYIVQFDSLESLLIEKYGKPSKKVRRSSSNRYIQDADAIALGEGIYYNDWNTKESQITLMLSGDKSELRLGIYYLCPALEKEKKKQDKTKAKDNL